jgi:tricorn protease interacting factor F2/3
MAINYKLEIQPNLTTFKFSGKETITMQLDKPVDKIIINSAELGIEKCEIMQGSKKITPKLSENKEDEELILSLNEKLSGEIKIFFEFTGTHNDQLVGFYRSKYTDKNKEKYLATTQFEAADARRCFPCFDHPEKKATFDITLITEKNLTAISNMPVKEEKVTGNKKSFTFGTTPIMSTYLVYLAAGEFEYVEDKVKPIIRVYTTPGKKEQGRFALDLGRKFLTFYENYFKIPYPLPKMDMIAIPDFAAGAMENWGAITYRENALLFDTKFSSTATKQRIAEVVAHEIAHQWFGNLVTMKWWNDLWLNESFATYMATKAVDVVFPEFDFWSQFMSDSTDAAMRLDSLKSSHPIEAKVNTPKEIAEIFDDISYDKGGSILRMLNHYLGEKDFIEGIKNYLNEHKYGNSESVDLWDSFEKASGKPIKKMLASWITKTGYPMVEANFFEKNLTLKQKRFLYEGDDDKALWIIPVTGLKEPILFDTKEKTVRIEKITKLNLKQSGFYRVKYSKIDIESFKRGMKEFSNIDRWGLQNDLYALSYKGENNTKDYLDFVRSYENEKDYLVLSDIQDNLYGLYALTFSEKFNPKIKEECLSFAKKSFQLLGWEKKKEEPHTYAMLRAKTLAFMGKLGDKNTVNEAIIRFDSYLKDKNSLSPDLQGAVFSICAWHGNSKTYDLFKQLYKNAETQEEKVRFIGALSGFNDETLIARTFDFMLSDEIRFSDIIYVMGYLAGNPSAKKMLWPWTKKNWKKLDERLGETKMLLRRALGNLKVLSDYDTEKDIASFFSKTSRKGIEMALNQTLEKIRVNAKALDRMRKEFS